MSTIEWTHNLLLDSLRGMLMYYKPSSPEVLLALRSDELMLGCMTDEELLNRWYNGSTPDRAKRPGVTPPLMRFRHPSSYMSLMDWRNWCTDQYARDRIEERREVVETDNDTDPLIAQLFREHLRITRK